MTTRSLKTVTITEERQAGAEISAGFFIYRNNDAQGIALSNKPPWLTG
jgi:hypothetical protein